MAKYTFFVHNSGGTQYLIRDIELPQRLTDASGNALALNTVDDYKARLSRFGITVDSFQTQSIPDALLPAVYTQGAPAGGLRVFYPEESGSGVPTINLKSGLEGVRHFFTSSVGVLVILAAVAWFALHLERG